MVSESRRSDSTAAQTRDALRDAILGGEYMPGERLVEAQLTERFGASRFTVRVALQDLAGEGLVEVQRNRGALVRKVSLDEAVEITEVRMVLEGLVAARAAERVTDEQASELDEIGLLMRRAVTAGEFRRYSDLNQRLHALIRSIAGHRTASSSGCTASWSGTSSCCRCCRAGRRCRCRSTSGSSRPSATAIRPGRRRRCVRTSRA